MFKVNKAETKEILRRCSKCKGQMTTEPKHWKKCSSCATKWPKGECIFCGTTDISIRGMNQHYKSCPVKVVEMDPQCKSNENKNKIYCTDCGKSYLYRNRARHIDRCKESRLNKVECEKCHMECIPTIECKIDFF